MNCANHIQEAAIAACTSCQKPLCESCTIHAKNGVICKQCLERASMQERKREGMRKSPTLAGLLSLMPGLGQAYVGYYKNGFITILIVAAVITLLESNDGRGGAPFFGLFLSFFWIFNIIDAVRKARLYNQHIAGEERVEAPTDSPLAAGIVLLILGLLATLTVTFDVDMDFIEDYWPLALLAGGVYLLWKYVRTRNEMAAGRGPAALPPAGPATYHRSDEDGFGS